MKLIIIIVAIVIVLIALGFIYIRYVKPNRSHSSVIRIAPPNKKNKVEIFFSDIGEPFLFARVYENNLLTKEKVFSIGKEQIEDGKIFNVENIIEQLKDLKIEKYSIDLILCSQMIFELVISLPKVNAQRAEQLKKKEIKESFEKYKDFYYLIEKKYAYNLGLVYTEYFVSNAIVDNWRQIAKGANAKLSTIRLFGDYLYETMKKGEYTEISVQENLENQEEVKETKKANKLIDFALIFVHDFMATFVLSTHDQLIGFYSFEFSSKEELMKRFLLVIGKHEIELEKRTIKDIFVDSDIDLSLDQYLMNQTIHYIRFKKAEIEENNISSSTETISSNTETEESPIREETKEEPALEETSEEK